MGKVKDYKVDILQEHLNWEATFVVLHATQVCEQVEQKLNCPN